MNRFLPHFLKHSHQNLSRDQRDQPPPSDVDDNTLLKVLDKDQILKNLEIRFARDCIYTFTASVLLSVNPWKEVPGLYSAEMQMKYTNKSIHALPPHPYALADTAYRYFYGENKSQAVVISGESGSGKTETAKRVISFLSSHKERRRIKTASDSPLLEAEDRAASLIHDKIINANPILEAFGNAATIRNKNSSRFGKYHRLLYDRTGRLSGADVKPFLLESSRVTGVSVSERNFHVFYQLLGGMGEMELAKIFLSKSGTYPLVSNGAAQSAEQRAADKAKFEELMNSFSVVGFSNEDVNRIMQIVAGLLLLSSVEFEDSSAGGGIVESADPATPNQHSPSKPCVVKDPHVVDRVAQLFGFESSALNKILLYKTSKINNRGSSYLVPRSLGQVEAARATLIRIIYKRLFERIVDEINAFVKKETLGGFEPSQPMPPPFASGSTSPKKGRADPPCPLHMGILDIFGFENLEKNSFEQLCINLTNEKLQQFFIRKVLEAEQKTYQAEGIGAAAIVLPDCSETLGVIKTVLDLLDDHCIRISRNMVTDEEKFCMQVFNQSGAHKSDSRLVMPRTVRKAKVKGEFASSGSTKPSNDAFIVRHYAGEVLYTVGNWFEKNNERMSPEMEVLLRDSRSDWVAKLSDSDACSYACERFKSVKQKFTSELDAMLGMLDQCCVHYVRCFNPNNLQKPAVFDAPYVTEQVVQCGTVELVKVMHMGFPNRQPLKQIADSFQPMLPFEFRALSPRDFVDAVMHAFGIPKTDFAIGFTTLFLKAGQIQVLEALKGVGENPSLLIVQKIRRRVAVKKFKRCVQAVMVVNWLPKLKRDLRRKKLFQLAANLAVTLGFIKVRIRGAVESAKLRVAEKRRLEEEKRQMELKRLEEQILAEEKRKAEEKRLQEEQRKMEEARLAKESVASLGKENQDRVNRGPVSPSNHATLPALPPMIGNTMGKLAQTHPVTAHLASNVSMFYVASRSALLLYDGLRVQALLDEENLRSSRAGRRSSSGNPNTMIPTAVRNAPIGAVAQHPIQKDLFASTQTDEIGAITVWRLAKGVESRFRIHLGNSGSAGAQETMTTSIKRICFIAPDNPNTDSPIYCSSSHLLAVLVECGGGRYLIFVEVVAAVGSPKRATTSPPPAPQFKVHKVEPIIANQLIVASARSLNFLETSASGRVVVVGGKGLLMMFVVGLGGDNSSGSSIQVDLLAEHSYFPQIQTVNFLSFTSLFPREDAPSGPSEDYEEEQIIISSNDGNMFRFPILLNRTTCALDISGCGKLRECSSTLFGRRIMSLVKKADDAYYSVTADGCIDKWVWKDKRPYRDSECSIALVAEDSDALFSSAKMINKEIACLDAHAGKLVAFNPSDPEKLNPRLLYQFNQNGALN